MDRYRRVWRAVFWPIVLLGFIGDPWTPFWKVDRYSAPLTFWWPIAALAVRIEIEVGQSQFVRFTMWAHQQRHQIGYMASTAAWSVGLL